MQIAGGLGRSGVVVDAEVAEDQAEEDRLDAYGREGAARDDGAGGIERIEVSKVLGGPTENREEDEKEAGEEDKGSGEEAFFESEKVECARQGMLRGKESPGKCKYSGEAGEEDHLIPKEEEEAGNFEGVKVKVDGADRDGSSKKAEEKRAPHGCREDAGVEQKPTGREEQHETEVPPTVAPTAEMGRTRAPVFMKRDGNFRDAKAAERSFDDHFGGKLHSASAEVEFRKSLLAERPEAAVEVVAWASEEDPPDESENGVANPSVFPRHGSGDDGAAARRHSTAHDEI